MLSRWVYRPFDDWQNVSQLRITNRNGERFEWDVRKWKNVIDVAIKEDRLNNLTNEMERKKTLDW